jgi:proline dehydrogenase
VSLVDRAIVKALPAVPKPIVKRISQRYIAGTELEDAVRVVRRLNRAARMATIDVLGEEVTTVEEARAFAKAYDEVLTAIEREELDSNISVKLSALGLELSYECARENLEALVQHARGCSNFVRIDMEDSSTTDDTLGLYRELRAAGYDNVGVVLQAYLRRTLADVPGLHNVRLCKGIYVEPPEIAFQDDDEIRRSFVAVLDALLAQRSYVGIATHDEWLIDESLKRVRERYEFQMLLGVREELGDRLVNHGHPLRIYVPFGRRWYAYSLRRLQENPKIARYVAGDVLGRVVGRG